MFPQSIFFFNSKGELKSKHEVKLKEKIFDAYGERWKDDEIDKNINKHLHNVKKCMEHRDLVGDQRFGRGWGCMAQYNFFSGLEKGHIIYIFFCPLLFHIHNAYIDFFFGVRGGNVRKEILSNFFLKNASYCLRLVAARF